MQLGSSCFPGRQITLPSRVHHEQQQVHSNKSWFHSWVLLGKKGTRPLVNSRMVNIPAVCATLSDMSLLPAVTEEKPLKKKIKVRASVTVRRRTRLGIIEKIVEGIDAMMDKVGRNILLELISTDVDPMTKEAKRSGKASLGGSNWLEKMIVNEQQVVYITEFTVDSSFGLPGAILVGNMHQREIFLETVVLEGFLPGPVRFHCYSWLQSVNIHREDRLFFSNTPYLPSETPAGLKELREKELKALRGDGTGERKTYDRVYDFDVYNDLGNPDKGSEWRRPVLGGKQFPYPRRCRTGRTPTVTDKTAERRVQPPKFVYVPRDEKFEEGKNEMIDAGERKAKFHVLFPSVVATSEECHDFEGFHELDDLYKKGLWNKKGFFREIQELFRYDNPAIITKDNLAWLRDDEFARQAIAGINPVSIQRLREFPPRSKLDSEIYGPPESAIKEEHILGYLDGMSVQQALEEKKLYMLDFHDIYLPFIDRINSQPGHKAYATRTLFFLTRLGTLKPIAIELCLPPPVGTPKRVLTPPVDATTTWLWQLAKAHVCSNDAGAHQLINHFLKTHACMEPFILSAHRHLSTMHPLFRLLKPHMRYTLEINGLARQILISAFGVIESFFTPGNVSMEISSAFYKDAYRFDREGLPDDLLARGMAEPADGEDGTDHLRLLIPDYPYASDGLLIWTALEKWVRACVTSFYPNDAAVQSDTELQDWYSEAINVGHQDTSHCSWWPTLSTSDDVVSILTKIIWLCSAQHAALNFGQYPLGGYIPNRPPLMRRLIPEESNPEYKSFLSDPQRFFLSSLPSLLQTTKFMTVIDTLSTHSVDEEYMGEKGRWLDHSWKPEVAKAYEEFVAEMRRVEEEIEKRNGDTNLRNRCGAGVLPYRLLMASSGPGITCRGVPNSITI